jgi:RNA recognition motif-containing protein
MGVVEFRTPEEARRAVNELNGQLMQDRRVFVKIDETSPNNYLENKGTEEEGREKSGRFRRDEDRRKEF